MISRIIRNSLCILLSLYVALWPVSSISQTATLLPNGMQQFFDNNGNPLSSGTVDFYIPSTTTRKNTWQDAAETIVNTNPITLDGGGRALIYGDGSYRQVLKDSSANLIWDKIVSSYANGNTIITTGDGDLVGTIKPWAGILAPNQYAFANGQEISRTTFSVLFTAITQIINVACTSGSATLTGMNDTTQIPVNAKVELSCVPSGTIVLSKTSTSVTLNNTANVNLTADAVFFPYGNGNGTTTFNVPDLRGVVVAGRPNMGGIDRNNLSSTYFGVNPSATGALGGSESKTLLAANLPPYTPTGTVGIIDPQHGHLLDLFNGSGTPGNAGVQGTAQAFNSNTAGNQAINTLTGITATFTGSAQGGTSAPISAIQPTLTLNYIIKVTPDTSAQQAIGVSSLGGMVGVIACGAGLLCTGNVISLNNFGSVTCSQLPALTGDITTSAGNCATSITTNIVTNAKLAQAGAATLKMNATAGTANSTDTKISALTDITTVNSTLDWILIEDHIAGTIKKVNASELTAAVGSGVTSFNGLTGSVIQVTPPQGRVTLASLTPVMTTSVPGATTIYYTPYNGGNMVTIYNGTNMVPTIFTELSVATTDATKSPAAIGASKVNDWFIWNDAGTLRIGHGPDWTNDTTRSAGTALVRVNGVLLNNATITNGPAASRGTYVGTTRSNGSSTLDYILGSSATGGGQAAFLNVWNMYNRVEVKTSVTDSAVSWNINDGLVHSFHDDAGTRLNFVTGQAEDSIGVNLFDQVCGNNAIGYPIMAIGVALDRSGNTTFDKVALQYENSAAVAAGNPLACGSLSMNYTYTGLLGFHFIQALANQDGQATVWTGTYYGGIRTSFDGTFRN